MNDLVRIAGRLIVLAALAATGVGPALAATAGVFQFVAGDVRVILALGSERPAAKGAPISVGDTISTAKASMAQIKMGDGAIVVVQPESRLTIAEFRYNNKEDGTEKVVFRLEEGGFRSVTGAIGHLNKGNYLIETPIAHIGVRGTDHESYYFPVPRSGNGEPARAGLYNKVNVGLTYIRTQSGEVVIGPNQVGYAASARDVPQLLTAMPGFFNRAIEPKSIRGSSPAGGGGPQVAASQGGASAPQVIQTVTTTDGVPLSAGSSTESSGSSGTPAGSTGSVVGYTTRAGAGASLGQSGVNLGVSPNGATLANTGGDPAFGVNWGSWQGGLATVGGVATDGATHFATSTNLTSSAQLGSLGSTLMSATYSYAGGPAPTNSAGTQGTINSLSVGVDFSKQTITSYSVSATINATPTVAATAWNASGSGSIANFTGASGIAINGSCSGCSSGGPGGPAANGTAHGAFVGNEAQKMITSFGLKSGTQAMSGVGYLTR